MRMEYISEMEGIESSLKEQIIGGEIEWMHMYSPREVSHKTMYAGGGVLLQEFAEQELSTKLASSRFRLAFYESEEEEGELLKVLREIKKSIKSGVFGEEEIHKLIEIREFAKEHHAKELQKKVLEVVKTLWETQKPETIGLKENELVQIDEDIFAKRGKDGRISIFALVE